MSLEQVYSSRAEFSAGSPSRLGRRHLVPLAAALILCAATYAGTVGGLYLQNHMWTVPLSEIGSEAYDPGDLAQPRGDALLGFLAIMLTPWVAGVGLFTTGVDVACSVREGRTRHELTPALVVLVLAAVVLLAYLAAGPLSTWYMD